MTSSAILPRTDPRPRQPPQGAAVLRRQREASILRQAGLLPRATQRPRLPARIRVRDLKAGQPVGRMELLVLRRYPRHHVASSRYVGPMAAAAGRDESGVVGIVLWGDQVDQVRVGDVIRIERGWCRHSKGQFVVSTGRHGRLDVLHA